MKGVTNDDFKKSLPEPFKSSDIYAYQTAIKIAQCVEILQSICDLLQTAIPSVTKVPVQTTTDNSVIDGQVTLDEVVENKTKKKRSSKKKNENSEVI